MSDLVKATSAELAAPSYLDGFETDQPAFGHEDLKQPFLKILHKPIMSDDGRQVMVPAGDFVHSITNESFGPSIDLVVLKWEKAFVEWEPDGGNFVGKYSYDEAHKLGKFNKSDDGFRWTTKEGNNLVETHYYYVMVANRPDAGMLVFGLKTTGIKHARNWNTKIFGVLTPSGKRAPIFAKVWRLTTMKNVNANNQEYFQIGKGKESAITSPGWISQDFFDKFVRGAVEMLKSMDTSTIVETVEVHEAADAADWEQ